jgi:hypothetical protein
MRSKYAKQPVRGKEDFSLQIKITAMGVRVANLFALLR